jgi:hypothetical protein
VTSSNFPPTNCTGAPNAYTCQFCHSTYSPNIAGGGINLTGIPATFTAGKSYPFSINIKHFASDRKKFGYDVTALDALGNQYGTFSTSNGNSTINAGELTSHLPVQLAPTNQSTISGFSWNAPATAPTADQLPITFYFCGNACNGDGTAKGDYVYNDSVSTTMGILPIVLKHFEVSRISENEIQLRWSLGNPTTFERCVIQKSIGGGLFFDLASVYVKSGASSSDNYTYNDNQKDSPTRISYRIKSISKEGTVSFSEVKLIGTIKNSEISRIYPNPIRRNNILRFVFSSNQDKVITINIINKLGVLLFSKKQSVFVGSNTIALPIGQNFVAGTYILTLCSENSILNKRDFVVE